jgi:hypothetical protein
MYSCSLPGHHSNKHNSLSEGDKLLAARWPLGSFCQFIALFCAANSKKTTHHAVIFLDRDPCRPHRRVASRSSIKRHPRSRSNIPPRRLRSKALETGSLAGFRPRERDGKRDNIK